MSALGYLVAALSMRRDANQEPFTVLSCDNLQGNGELTRKLCIEYASVFDEGLANWIEEEVCFPNSMVDRITPATTKGLLEELERDFGIIDGWPIVAEDFTQWVVEEKFSAGRPKWENVGALFT